VSSLGEGDGVVLVGDGDGGGEVSLGDGLADAVFDGDWLGDGLGVVTPRVGNCRTGSPARAPDMYDVQIDVG
jgi:hypothetical protein